MSNYIDFGRLPITEAEVTDSLFGIREDGELVRCQYYNNPTVDNMIASTEEVLTNKITNTEERLTVMINNVRRETVDIIGKANNRLSNI